MPIKEKITELCLTHHDGSTITNLMSYDQIFRTTLISLLVLTGTSIGYIMVRYGVTWMVEQEQKAIKELLEAIDAEK